MKKTPLLFLLPLVFLCLWGCAAPAAPGSPSGSGEDWAISAEPEYLSEWPENDFTASIPRPEAGEIHYVCDYSDAGRYLVVLQGMSRQESADYLEVLVTQGYNQLLSEEGEASSGALLQKDGTVLSVAFSEDSLSILISRDSAS